MSDSEKLAELISEIQYMGGLESRLAEHLIANGVTIQKWIPVTERLPETKGITSIDIDGCFYEWERSDFVLGIDEDGDMHVVQYGGDEWCKWWEDEPGKYYDITHWMPLPEPPKEVE